MIKTLKVCRRMSLFLRDAPEVFRVKFMMFYFQRVQFRVRYSCI